MRLTLYHDDKDPYVVMNVIKLSIDELRTLAVRTKGRGLIDYKSFRFSKDYQRLTIELD